MPADSGHRKEVGASTRPLQHCAPSRPSRQLFIIKAVSKWGNQGQKGVVTCPESYSEAVAVSGFNIVSFCLLSIPLLLGVRKDLHRGLSEL